MRDRCSQSGWVLAIFLFISLGIVVVHLLAPIGFCCFAFQTIERFFYEADVPSKCPLKLILSPASECFRRSRRMMIQKHSPKRGKATSPIDDGSRRSNTNQLFQSWFHHLQLSRLQPPPRDAETGRILASWSSDNSIICDRKRYVLPPIPRRVVRVVSPAGRRNEDRKDIKGIEL